MISRNVGLWCLGISLLIGFSGNARSQEKQDEEIRKLKERITELEKTVAELKNQRPEEASDFEKELAQELGVTKAQTQTSQQAQNISQTTLSARSNFFQNMNPNISVIGSVLGTAHSLDDVERNIDLAFEEGEFSFQAAVDPYAKAEFFVTFVREDAPPVLPPGEVGEESGEGGLHPEVEEAFITLLHLPFSTQLKAGRFRSKFGKINETHPHAYNFIGVPQMYQNFLGAEGIADEGVGLSWLLPQSVFFQELSVQVTSGPSENASFTRAQNNRLLYLAHLKNFFDLNENTTLELGFTGLSGPNNALGDVTNMFATDVTLKWKPLQKNRYKSFEFMSEFLVSNRKAEAADVTSLGFYSHLRYQLAKRWFIGGLFDYSEFPAFDQFNHQGYSGILQFFITEFQKFEVQYKYNRGNFFDSFGEFKARAVFVIGAHGAHQY